MNRPPRISRLSIAWLYCALVALFFAPYLLGLTAFTAGDFTRHYLPYSFFQQNSLLDGKLPVWNPHVNSGHPFLADTESAVFYPISNILLLLTSFNSTVVGRLYWLQVEAFIHILLACCFTALLVHRLTGRRMAGFAAGLVFGFSGYLTGYPPLQLGILRVAVWLPLILWLLLPEKSGKPVRSRWLLACAVHAVAFFANHPQTFLFLTYTVAGWMLTLTVSQLLRSPPTEGESQPAITAKSLDYSRAFQSLVHMIAYALVLISLTVSQLWPALEFTRLSVRSARPFHELSSGFPPEDMWQFVVPGVLTLYSPLYVGIAGLGLALIALVALLSNRFMLVGASPFARPAAIFFVVAGCLACLVSLGELLPIYPFLYRYAPGWSLFRGQERIAYLVALSVSVMSGYGFGLLPSLAVSWRRRFGWGFLLFVTGGIALVLTLWHLPGRLEVTDAKFYFHAVKSVLFASVFLVLCSRLRLTYSLLILLLFVIVVDLYATNFSVNFADGEDIRSELTRPEIGATMQAAQTLTDETTSLPPRVYNERRLPEDSGMVAGWEDVWAASVLRLSAYNGFFVDFPMDRMWNLTGVGTVLTWRQKLPVASQVGEEFPLENETTRLHTLKTVYPRLWWAQKARRTDDRSALALLADPKFDPRQEVLVAESDAEVLGEAWEEGRMNLGDGGEAFLEALRIGPAHMEIQIDSTQPGLLFVSENFLPGWQAEWTEAERPPQPTSLPIVRAHQAFLGIPVPAGSGTLELAYRPASVRWGLAISAVSWIGLILVLRRQFIGALGTVWIRIRQFTRKLWLMASLRSAPEESLETREKDHRESCASIQGLFSEAWFQRATVALATLAGFALRFYRLDEQELLPREAFSFWFSQDSYSRLTEMFNLSGETLFFTSFLLQQYWLNLVGTTEFALRSASALLGTLAIPLIYSFAKELRFPAVPCLTAAILMAMSSYAIRSSQDVPLYSLSLTLTVASAVLALRLVHSGSSRVNILAYALCGAATVYTHIFAVLALLAQNLYVLFVIVKDFRGRKNSPSQSSVRSMLKRWVWAQFSIVAFCIPWLVSAWSETFDFTGGITVSSLISLLWWRFSSFPIGSFLPDKIWLLNAGLLGVGLVAAAIYATFWAVRQGSNQDERATEDEHEVEHTEDIAAKDSLLLPAGLSPTVLLPLFLIVSPIAYWSPLFRKWSLFGSFYSVFFPPFLLLLALGLAKISDWIESVLGWRWRIWTADAEAEFPTFLNRIHFGSVATVSLILVLVAGNLFTLRNYHYEPEFSSSRGLRELSSVLERWSAGLNSDEVRILQSFPDPTIFLYYYKGEVEYSVLPRHDHDLKGATEEVNELRERDIQRILLPVSLDDDQEAPNLARQALSSAYQKAGQETVGPWLVELYSRPLTEAWRLLEVEFANGLILERAQVSPNFPPAAGRMVVHMEWRGDPATLTGGEKIFLHLLDENGNLIAQWDPELRMVNAKHRTAAAMPIPLTLPAGSLHLVAGLYDVTVEGAPRIPTDSGEDFLQLAYFHVTDCDVCGR